MTNFDRLVRRLGHQRWFARLGRALVPLDLAIQRRTKGKLSIIGPVRVPQLLLTTTGRVSGRPRTVPLGYGRAGDDFVVVASNWGQAHHPAWSTNLLADPAATVDVAGELTPVSAVLAEGRDRERLWRLITEIWPAYDTYAVRSGRDLRVFLLSPTRR